MEQLFNKAYRALNDFFELRLARWIPEIITPNAITISRVFFVAPIIIFLFLGINSLAIIFFIFSALLDYVDGALARGRGDQSELGAFLDPICDKIFFCAIAIVVSVSLFSASPPTIIGVCLISTVICLVCVELLLAFVRIIDFLKNQLTERKDEKINLQADWSGKIKFNLQMIGAGLLLLAYPNNLSGPAIYASVACLALSLPLAAISLIHKLQSEE